MDRRPPTRRQVVGSALAGLLAPPPAWPVLAVDDDAGLDLDRPADGWAAEAARLTRRVQDHFWDADRRHYVSPVAAEGTVATEDDAGRAFHGHTLWPWTEAFQMLAAAAAHERPGGGRYARDLAAVFAGLERYHDPARSCYNAWVLFPGNVDSYSDDNAWLVMAFCEATAATGERRYAERADQLMEGYIRTEWRDDDGPLGMRWGYKPDGPRHGNMRAAISASTAAVGAMRLANLGFNAGANLARAAEYLDWIERLCVGEDGLVMDGLQADGEGGWTVEQTRWTYNTGLFLLGTAMLHERTARPDLIGRLRRTADAATDRSGRMYDGLVTDSRRNYFYDNVFFASHLIEGLVAASRTLGDPKYRREAERAAAYFHTFVRDPADGIYFRNTRLWRIDRERFERFQRDFAGGYDADALRHDPADDERSRDPADLLRPVNERPTVKTLLANAAVARAYWVVG